MQESERCRAFIRSVELGSLGAAAEEMGFLPSTISRMVASLEQEWGVRLMERSRNGLTVTCHAPVGAGYRLCPSTCRTGSRVAWQMTSPWLSFPRATRLPS